MSKKVLPIVRVKLNNIVGGGQAIGTLKNGCKIFVWGGLPGETVEVQITKKKSKLYEGVVTKVIRPSKDRVLPHDKDSYLSTSPWQIMNFDSEQHYKSALIEEAFELHDIVLPNKIEVCSENKQYEYRNKIEFSWYWDKECKKLDLAFFKRASHNKIPVKGTSLAHPNINKAAIALRDLLRTKPDIRASILKTVIIRCDKKGNVVMQLYVKDKHSVQIIENDMEKLNKATNIIGFELIYSNPKSPASVISEHLWSWGITKLTDTILDIPFTYATDGFLQINLPVYEQALHDIKKWVSTDKPIVDLYSGVGTIGLTIGEKNVTLVEIDKQAVSEMKQNIASLKREKTTKAIFASCENALEYITKDSIIIIDPPRVGLHNDVISKLLEIIPERIVYLSCNPITQARDIAFLLEKYNIRWHQGYNFFPRTPHIEHLIILDPI